MIAECPMCGHVGPMHGALCAWCDEMTDDEYDAAVAYGQWPLVRNDYESKVR